MNKNEFVEFCDEYEKKELVKNIKSTSPPKNKKIEENLLLLLNKSNKEDDQIETSKTQKGPMLENINDGILKINTDQLFKEYCSNSFNENSLFKYENMFNDFKIILKLIESLKGDYKANSTNGPTSFNSHTNNLLDL